MKKKKKTTAATAIKCQVSPGMFSTERGVRIKLPDGRTVYTIVDERNVQVNSALRPGTEVEGRLRVSVVEMKGKSAVVYLPQSGLTEGTRITVPKAMLK
jgi:hypothetical protein